MFRWKEIVVTVVLAVLAIFGFLHFMTASSADEEAYQQLMALSSNSATPQQTSYTTQQQRIGVDKDLYFTKGTDRLHSHLTSDSSELHLDYHHGRAEVVEHFKKMHCVMQEELIHGTPPKQMIRSVDAENATYHYKTNRMIAQNVKISRAILPGHELVNDIGNASPLMNGVAKSVSFSLDGNDIKLDADGIDASFSDGEKMSVVSKKAEYNGKETVLTGNAILKHPLGKMSANKVTLLDPLLTMEDKVLIEFKKGGVLHSDKANIDYVGLTGHFYGNPPDGEVFYNDPQTTIKSRQMDMKLNSQRQLESLEAHGQVVVTDNDEMTAMADRAIYQHNRAEAKADVKNDSRDDLRFAGSIILKMADADGLCTILHRNGDKILSKEVNIDTIKHRITFKQSKGNLTSRAGDETSVVEFFARQLVWNEPDQLLTLSGDVVIDQRGLGRLRTDHDVKAKQQVVDGKKKIKSILCSQETVLTYIGTEKKGQHTLTCHGPLNVDHDQMQTVMESSLDSNGNVPEGKQVHFEDRLGEVYADRAEIDYTWTNDRMEPTKITLKGNVKLFNRAGKEGVETGAVHQYALADEVVFLPKDNVMNLTAQKGRRVLFFDKENDVQVSALALKIQRDKTTNKDAIQGVGDVRFNFIEHEFDQLKQLFEPRKP